MTFPIHFLRRWASPTRVRLKREIIRDYKDPLELELMRSVKQVLDPRGRMNPGKVL